MKHKILPLSNAPVPLLEDRILREHFASQLRARQEYFSRRRDWLLGGKDILEFADWQDYFALQRRADGKWIFREWLPGATGALLVGEFSGWQDSPEYALHPIGDDIWEGIFPGAAIQF